jgi:nitrous oxide reductase
MKNCTSFIVVTLLASLVVGCSNHSSSAPKVADLGVVEVTNGGTNRVTSEDGRIFVVRSLVVKDQKVKNTADDKDTILKGQTIILMISQEQTDSHGVTHLSQEQGIGATPGQTVGVSDGVVSIRITPKIKI